MQDIRKPYSRSRSDHTLSSKVEQFESRSYEDDDMEKEDEEPVHIPMKRIRRNVNDMDMYPRRRHDDINTDGIRSRPHEDDYEDGTRTRYRKSANSTGTLAFIVTVVVLVVGAWLLTYVFNNATATIVPKFQDIEVRKAIVFANTNAPQTVSFIVATSTITKSKQLPLSESKKVEAKASGRIVIYNNFDTTPQKLIKNTRFESSSGKIYRINESVTVPGKKGDTPGSIEVTVYADSYGAAYNIAPSDFTVPGFKGSPRYSLFFARSNGPMVGGASGNMSLASLSDINAAKDELALELTAELKADLAKVQKEGFVGLYSAIEVTYVDNEGDVLSGLTSAYQATGTGYLMLADENILAQTLARDMRDYNNELVQLGYSDSILYTRKDTDHIFSSESLSILAEGKPRIIWKVDEGEVKNILIGKKRADFKPLMETVNSIKGAEISFSPFWLSTFPSETNKISIVESLPER